MVSKSQIKLISSLQQKKGRLKNNLFFVEGIKGIRELLNSEFELYRLFTTADIFEVTNEKKNIVSTEELKKISRLTNPQTALALFKIPQESELPSKTELILALDGVRDPGNLGTIIRLCDWFGIKSIICSNDTVDCYNPKVVQASMGSIARINICYVNLEEFIKTSGFLAMGTFLDGENIYTQTLPEKGLLIMGNEANGISSEIEKLVKLRLKIPQAGTYQDAESLNVATATAIILSEFKRPSFTER